MSQRLWELLTFYERICPSCKSSWIPSVDNPMSCPRCKSYSLSKTRQPWPEGYVEFNFSPNDFEVRDPEWIAEQGQIDRDVRLQKRVIFEKIFKEWSKEFIEYERKEKIATIIKMFKNKDPIWEIGKKFGMSEREVMELLVAQGAARWAKNQVTNDLLAV
jgi:hypothetical protein